jgi:AraC-like DNA-binding protein
LIAGLGPGILRSVTSRITMYSAASGAGVPGRVVCDDIDRARGLLCEAYYPLRLDVLGDPDRFTFGMTTVDLGPLTLGELTFGADISLDCGDLRTAYHVNIPLVGQVESEHGRNQVVATPTTGAVFSPVGRTRLTRWHAGSTQLCLKIDRAELEGELSERLEIDIVAPVRFRFPMDLAAGATQGWLGSVRTLAAELSRPGGLTTRPVLAAELQQSVVTGLLLCQEHNYSDALRRAVRPPRPRAVQVVVDLIEGDPGHPWTIPDLARAGGVSVRALEHGFSRHLGTSPRSYLRERRLLCAREELANALPGEVSVTEVAYRWGFGHLGRFAHAYRTKFGVTPSRTLRGLEDRSA